MAERTARDIMTTDVKLVKQDAKLAEVAEYLIKNGIGGAPVVNADGALVGIVSETDLLDEKKRDAVIPRLGLFGLWVVPDESLKAAYKEGFYVTARDLMTERVVTAAEDTPVDELARMMLSKKINRIPIVTDGRIVGIVTRQDLLKGMLKD